MNATRATEMAQSGERRVQTIKGLLSDAPDHELKEKLMLFGQFVGDWKINAQWFESDGSTLKGKGEVHFGWVLDGRAIQDVWMKHEADPPRLVSARTTIRFYDPKIDAWQCVWVAPLSGTVRTFLARQVGDEIVLEGTTEDGHPERWIYSEIRSHSFQWRALESRDNRKTWKLTEEMLIQRTD
jgi:hypothetical protein